MVDENQEITHATLHYIADYSAAGFSGADASGNFIALHLSSNAPDAVFYACPEGGTLQELESNIAIFRVASTSDVFMVGVLSTSPVAQTESYSVYFHGEEGDIVLEPDHGIEPI